MASSNSYNFTVTRDQIITDALLHIGVIGEGETPSANAVTEAARMLNMLLKLRVADGMLAWAVKRAVLLPVTGVSSVQSNSHVVEFGSYVETAIDVAEGLGETVVSVDSATGISASDQIGVEQDDGTMHWTTVNGAPAGNNITLTAALTAAAGEGNKVYAYTAASDRIPRPLRIVEANILETTDDSRREIFIEDRRDHWTLSNLAEESIPLHLYYEPTLGDNTADPTTGWYGILHFFPRFFGGDNVVEFSYVRPIQDFDAATDNPNFPQEFYLPIVLELAALLAPRYGVDPTERARLFSEAKAYLEEALTTVYPEGSWTLQPERDRG